MFTLLITAATVAAAIASTIVVTAARLLFVLAALRITIAAIRHLRRIQRQHCRGIA
jgi:hypothetical protein